MHKKLLFGKTIYKKMFNSEEKKGWRVSVNINPLVRQDNNSKIKM